MKFSETKLAASLQTIISRRREAAGLYQEIARQLPLENAQRVLDVGTGTGLQLKVIQEVRPGLELYGLDLSPAAIQSASRALGDLKVDLRAGSISSTDYEADFFDIVTCNASMSYWENPRECFNEIHRILKPKGSAWFFEPHKDIDIEGALDQIRENMADQSPLRRRGAVKLNKYGLKKGTGIGMKLYSVTELKDLVKSSAFGDHHSITKTSLLKIPIFVCIQLWK